MHITLVIRSLVAVALFLSITFASPIVWSEEELEAINALRAKGASEVKVNMSHSTALRYFQIKPQDSQCLASPLWPILIQLFSSFVI